MNFKKKSIFLTICLAITSTSLMGCGDDVVLSSNENVKVKSDVTIVVRDAATGSFIDSAMVIKVDTREDTNYTEAIKGGAIVFQDILVGNQYFKIEKANYASKVITASVVLAAEQETPIASTPSFSIDLPEMGAAVKGVVTQENIKGEKALVKAQAVRLILNDKSFITREFSTTTDSLGQYSFKNLPTGQAYVISFADLEATDGIKTAQSNSGVTLSKGSTLFETNSNFTLRGYSQTLLSTNVGNNDIKSTDTIFYTFSQPVNLESFETQDITVSSNGNIVPVSAAWSNGNTTLTITANAGEWFPGNATISGLTSIESISGQSLSGIDNTFNVNILGALTPMTNYSIDDDDQFNTDSTVVAHNTDEVSFKFTPLVNASSILVYSKEADDVNYKLIATKLITNKDSIIKSIPTNNYFEEAKTVSFVLVPKNDEGSSLFDPTTGISAKDGYLPYTTSQGSQAIADTVDIDYSGYTPDNTAETTNSIIDIDNITFNEPMDTTSTPAVPFGLKNTIVEYEWTSLTNLKITYSILAGKEIDILGDMASSPVYFAKDLAGNVSIDGIEVTVKQ